MAGLGVEAIAKAVETGEMPAATKGKAFFDKGVGLVTAAPVDGLDQLTVEEGNDLCWG